MDYKTIVKSSAIGAFDIAPVRAAVNKMAGSNAVIFMLHRFNYPELGISGHDVSLLRECLAYLRKRQFAIVSVEEIVSAAQAGEPLRNAVAFTIDDGYFDHADVGGSVFAEFDCPATFFLITDFVDGRYWPNDAKFSYILNQSPLQRVDWRKDGQIVSLDLSSSAHRKDAIKRLVWGTKLTTLAELDEQVKSLAVCAEVNLPEQPSPVYAPMTWADARRIESMGMRIGAHTCRHVLLSTESDEVASREISQSIEMVRRQVCHPSGIFCYPTGRSSDFGERERMLAEQAGCIGAVSATAGYCNPLNIDYYGGYYSVPRFALPNTMWEIKQLVLYIEKLKSLARGE